MLASLAKHPTGVSAAYQSATAPVQCNRAKQPLTPRLQVSESPQDSTRLQNRDTCLLLDNRKFISSPAAGEGYLEEICTRLEDWHVFGMVMNLNTQTETDDRDRQQSRLAGNMDALQRQLVRLKRSPALSSSGPSFCCESMEIAELARWRFCSHLCNSDTQMSGTTSYHWLYRVWDMAKHGDLILQCVAVSAVLKKAALIGKMDLKILHTQKRRLVRGL